MLDLSCRNVSCVLTLIKLASCLATLIAVFSRRNNDYVTELASHLATLVNSHRGCWIFLSWR